MTYDHDSGEFQFSELRRLNEKAIKEFADGNNAAGEQALQEQILIIDKIIQHSNADGKESN